MNFLHHHSHLPLKDTGSDVPLSQHLCFLLIMFYHEENTPLCIIILYLGREGVLGVSRAYVYFEVVL